MLIPKRHKAGKYHDKTEDEGNTTNLGRLNSADAAIPMSSITTLCPIITFQCSNTEFQKTVKSSRELGSGFTEYRDVFYFCNFVGDLSHFAGSECFSRDNSSANPSSVASRETCPTLRLPDFQIAAINGNARAARGFSLSLNRGRSL